MYMIKRFLCTKGAYTRNSKEFICDMLHHILILDFLPVVGSFLLNVMPKCLQ